MSNTRFFKVKSWNFERIPCQNMYLDNPIRLKLCGVPILYVFLEANV